MGADRTLTRSHYCSLPPHLPDDLVTEESGATAIGPYRLTWRSSRAPAPGRTNGWSEFVVVVADGSRATCTVNALRPPTPIARKGIEGQVQGLQLRIKRNGPRPLNVLRRTFVDGESMHLVARGSWFGTCLEDAATSQTLWRSHGRSSEMRSDLAADRAALVIALAANEIPQSMSLLFARV